MIKTIYESEPIQWLAKTSVNKAHVRPEKELNSFGDDAISGRLCYEVVCLSWSLQTKCL